MIDSSKTPLSSMTGARQTMMSWARVIDSFEALPEIFKKPYQAVVIDTSSMPYTILAPAQVSLRNRKPLERVLCELDKTLWVFEHAGEQVITTGYRYQDICSLEIANILLYSWFSISGRTIAGTDSTLTVEFNESTLRHFLPFLKQMRPAPIGDDEPGLQVQKAKFDHLSSENYKFMNIARAAVLPGEKVIQTILQAKIRRSAFSFLGIQFQRTMTPAHLTILTDKEIILVLDTQGNSERKQNNYGAIRRYFQLRFPVSTTLENRPGELLSLSFHAHSNLDVERLFEASRQPEIEAFTQALAGISTQVTPEPAL